MTKNENLRQKRTASPEERKRQLIEATITLISRNGITGTTLTALSPAFAMGRRSTGRGAWRSLSWCFGTGGIGPAWMVTTASKPSREN